jgi:VWFA-related protein
VRKLNSLPASLPAIFVALSFLAQPLLIRSQEPAETIRVTTQLVQSDVLVLDKNGDFVDGLKPEQFELRVNGKTRSISSLDRLVAGSANEEDRIAAARGQARAGSSLSKSDRGRTILFFLDDYHLSSNSLTRTRAMLTSFAERQMGPDDQVALITATGQLGFLEQFVTGPAVLHRVIGKLAHRSFSTLDAERTPMTESEAAAIQSEDRRVIDYFVDQLLREMGRRPRGIAAPMVKARGDVEVTVKARAKSILDQSTSLAVSTVSGLERIIRLTSSMPWRKTLFFVSDGFMIHDSTNRNLDLRRIASAAAQGATVIYSIDAQGLITGVPEASRRVSFNYGRTSGTNLNAISTAQQPLQSLAIDSAGKAILNTNEPEKDLALSLKEASNYYLLSWRPDEKDIKNGFHSAEISVLGRPDLNVRVRHGYTAPAPPEAPAPKKESNKKKKEEPNKPLPSALHSLAPRLDLPVSISVGYADVGEKAALVTATVEVPLEALRSTSASQAESAELDLMGASIDERGKPVTVFDQNLTIKALELKASKSERILYNHQLRLEPGLYQIRVAVQEKGSNRIGSAMQWIDVPVLSGKFGLSSLFIGEVDRAAMESGRLSVNASHRYRSGSTLGFFVSIYNAERGTSGSDLALQIQVFRDEQPVITKPLVKVNARQATDPARISYGEDLSLSNLPAGKYLLTITVIDRLSKKSSQQQKRFVVY